MTAPSHIISTLRHLHTAGGTLPHSSADAAALHHLRDVYGMVQQDAHGWHLTHPPQWLAPLPAASTLSMSVHIEDEVDTTQHAVQHIPSPCALFAEHQTAGTGQRGRVWFGLPADAIAVSLRLPAPAQPAGLSVALGAMLCTALSPHLRFKWPNDIITAQGHKVAGILTQIKGAEVTIGIGANWQLTNTLRRHIIAHGNTPAALAALPHTVSRQHCAVTIINTVAETIAAYGEGFAAFQTLAETVHITAPGTPLPVNNDRENNNADSAEKIFLGFAADGTPRHRPVRTAHPAHALARH